MRRPNRARQLPPESRTRCRERGAARFDGPLLHMTIFEYIMDSGLQEFKADFFRALAHPARIRVLETLLKRERTVQDLQTILALDQSVVSQHLAVLRNKNIVAAQKVGTSVRYAVRDPLLGELLETARQMFHRHLMGTQGLLRELRRERAR